MSFSPSEGELPIYRALVSISENIPRAYENPELIGWPRDFIHSYKVAIKSLSKIPKVLSDYEKLLRQGKFKKLHTKSKEARDNYNKSVSKEERKTRIGMLQSYRETSRKKAKSFEEKVKAENERIARQRKNFHFIKKFGGKTIKRKSRKTKQ